VDPHRAVGGDDRGDGQHLAAEVQMRPGGGGEAAGACSTPGPAARKPSAEPQAALQELDGAGVGEGDPHRIHVDVSGDGEAAGVDKGHYGAVHVVDDRVVAG